MFVCINIYCYLTELSFENEFTPYFADAYALLNLLFDIFGISYFIIVLCAHCTVYLSLFCLFCSFSPYTHMAIISIKMKITLLY
jgi:hypothetical protein